MTIKQRMDKALEMAGQTKGAEISQGALKSTPVLFKKFFPGRKAVVITDHFVLKSMTCMVLSPMMMQSPVPKPSGT